jgi:hypothetical protein
MFNMVDDENIVRGGHRYEFKPQLFLQSLKKTRSVSRSLSGKAGSIQHLPVHAGERILQEPCNSFQGYFPPTDASFVGCARGDLAYRATT